MNSKERETEPKKGYFRTLNVWHFMTEEEAKYYDEIDFRDWEQANSVWVHGPSGGWGSIRLAKELGLDLRTIDDLPPGTWISHDGSIIRQRMPSSD